MAENVYDIFKEDINDIFKELKATYDYRVLKIIYPDADDDDDYGKSNLYNVIDIQDDDKKKIVENIIKFADEHKQKFVPYLPALFVFYIFNNFPDLKADILKKLKKEEKLYDDINKLESGYSDTAAIWKNTELKDKEEKEEEESKKEEEEKKIIEANQKKLVRLKEIEELIEIAINPNITGIPREWPLNRINAYIENNTMATSNFLNVDSSGKSVMRNGWFNSIFQEHFANIQSCFYKDCKNKKLYENGVELYNTILNDTNINIEKAYVNDANIKNMQQVTYDELVDSNAEKLKTERTSMFENILPKQRVELLRIIVQCEIAVIKKLKALYAIRKYRIFIKQLKELNDDDDAAAIELVKENKEINNFVDTRIDTIEKCANGETQNSELFQKIFADEIQLFTVKEEEEEKEKDDDTYTYAFINKDFLINILTKEIEFSKDLNSITAHEIRYYLNGGSRKNTKRCKNLSKTTKRRKNVRKTTKRRKNIRKTNKRIYTKRKSTTRRRK
jgi:hypothetical protein